MSKEIDNLLDNLIKEIDAKEGYPAPKEPEAPKPTSEEAREKAEAIAKGVNKSYRRPPEPVRQSIPAPKITPVVEPEPVSHFSNQRPTDPAIIMHDRLDEDSLPAPDAERRPTQIMDMDGKSKKRKKRGKKQNRSIPAPPEQPKRNIPHIQVPDEFPPDPALQPAPAEQSAKPQTAEPVDPEREALVRSRAEKIREQLKKRTLEETPIIPPPSAEEIDDMLSGLEHPDDTAEAAGQSAAEENENIFEYLNQVLGVEEQEQAEKEQDTDRPRWFEDAPEPDTSSFYRRHLDDVYGDDDDDDEEDDLDFGEDADAEQSASRLRHLEDEEETEKPVNPIVAFFRNLFGKHDDEEEEEEEEETFEDDEPDDGDLPDEDETADEEFPETEVPVPENDTDYEPAPLFSKNTVSEPEEDNEETAWDETEDADEADSDDAWETADSYDLTEDSAEEEPATSGKRGFFREAFDESAEELAEVKAEPLPEKSTDAGIKQRFLSRNSYFVVGVIVFVLAVVGLISLISLIAKGAGGFFSGGSLKSQIEKALYPAAVVDIPAFNEPAELTPDGAISAAIVDIMMNDDLSGYSETFDMIAIPAEDVLARARDRFGVDVQSALGTVQAAGETFVFDGSTDCYNVSTTPMIFSYSPEVKSIKRNGDTYEVTVIFHGEMAGWQENSRNFKESQSKTMQATVEKKSTGFRVVRLVPAGQ